MSQPVAKLQPQQSSIHILLRRVRRRKKTHRYCGIKAILNQMTSTLTTSPMKIKQLSRQICDLFNQGSEQHEFSVFTIQKRIYDVCLVLKTVGTIGMINKQVYFTHQGPEELRSVWMRKCPKKIAETEERIRRKKNAVFKLKEALNVMRVLQKKRRCRMEPENEETISTENLIALFMNPADVEINNGIVSDTISRVSIRDPKNILSVVDLFLHLC